MFLASYYQSSCTLHIIFTLLYFFKSRVLFCTCIPSEQYNERDLHNISLLCIVTFSQQYNVEYGEDALTKQWMIYIISFMQYQSKFAICIAEIWAGTQNKWEIVDSGVE
jgi:hypothetical protein